MADGKIIIDTSVDSSGAEKDVKSLSGKLSGLAKTGLVAFTGAITAAGSAIGGLAGIATKYNSQMEDYFANFTVLLGSASEATKHVEDLKKFAAKTPFEMTGLADASKQLLSFGINVDDIMPDLQMLGDISLGNQERFKGLALVFAQVASAGKLTGQDLLQFINQGFNPLQVISEKTGKSMAELKKEMSDGAITYEMVAEAMKTATSEGGKFYQGMEVQSKTLSGMWSTLKDDTMSLIGGAFEPFSETLKTNVMPALQGIVGKMAEAFKDPNIQTSIANIAAGLGDFITKVAELVSEWLPKIIEGFAWVLDHSSEITASIVGIGTALMVLNVANIIMGLVKAFQAFKLANEGATVAQWLLNAAMTANPIGLIIAAIAGLIAGIVVLWNTNEGFRTVIINAWNSILAVGQVVWGWLVNFFTVDIPKAWNSMVTWFGSVGDWFVDLWNNIKQGFVNGWNSIVSFFTVSIPAWWEGVKQQFQDGLVAIKNFFTETIPALMVQVGEWFNELPYKIGYALGYALGAIAKWGVDTWNSFTTTCVNVYNAVTEWFSKLPERVYTFTMDVYNKVVKWGQDTWNNFIETCTNIYNSVTEWFSKLPGLIWDWLVNAYNKIVTWGTNAYNSMVSAVTNAINAVIQWFSTLPGRVWEWLVNTISKVVQFASNLGSKAREAGSNMVSNIISAVSNLPSQMAEIGSNIVHGVWNGITGMGSWLAGKVSGFFSGIVDGAKKALGIHSPSRVFRDQVGKYMAQGVGVGFEDESENIQSDMQDSLSNLTAKMQATVDYETSSTSNGIVASSNYKAIKDNINIPTNDIPEGSIFIVKNYMDSEEISEYTYKKTSGKFALAGKRVR